MKKIILLSVFAASVCFTQCKKKKDDPAPATTTTTTTTNTSGNNTSGNNTTGNNTTGTTTTAPTTASGSLTVGGVTQSFDVTTYQGSFLAFIGNSSTGTYKQFEVGYLRDSPSSKSIDLSSGDEPYIDFTNATTTYEPISGTAKITVNGASVTVEFTNAVFHPKDGSGNVTASGKLVGINK